MLRADPMEEVGPFTGMASVGGAERLRWRPERTAGEDSMGRQKETDRWIKLKGERI